METTADPGNTFSQQHCSCDGSPACCWCLDCGEALCDGCLSAHRRVTVTRSHRILNQPPAADVSTPPIKFCRLHPSEPLKLYCFTCNQLTCRDCQLTAHMNHRYQFVSEALDSVKKQMEAWVQPIRARRDTVRRSLQDMETRLQDIVESELNLQTELLQSYSVFAQWLKNRVEDILKDVKKVCELECEQIQERMAKLKQLQQSEQLATEIAEKAKNTNDLLALQTYTAQVAAQLKDFAGLDPSPPQTMFQLRVLTDRKSLEAVRNIVNLPSVRFGFPVSAGGLKLVQPSLLLNQATVAALLPGTQTASKVSCSPVAPPSAVPQSPILCSQTASLPKQVKPEDGRPVLNMVAAGNQSETAPPSLQQKSDQQPLRDDSCMASSSGPPPPPQRLSSDISPRSPSLKHQQQSPVLRAVADPACDGSARPAADTEPAGKPSAPEASSSVIGPPDRRLSQWQPRVSLFRLPVPPPRPGRPLPRFRLLPGNAEDELHLEVMDKDTQSRVDDITERPSPESPATLQIISCSACGSTSGSVVCCVCGRGYHRGCHVPPVGPDIRSEWLCSLCQDLSDPSDPYSSDRPPRPQSPRLSLQHQRRCEQLLLYLKVEGCSRLSEFGRVWSHLKLMSERLSLRRTPAYQTAAELLSDTWSLFRDASQGDDVLNRLQESFHSRVMETFSAELHPSVLRPPSSSSNAEAAKSAAGHSGRRRLGKGSKGSKVTAEEQVVTRKLRETRKRLSELLKETLGSKRMKKDKTDK